MMKIVNVVASGSFNQQVDLAGLISIGEKYHYDHQKYPGGYISLSSAKVTVYRTGNYIITGIKALDSLDALWKELVAILETHLDVTCFTPPEIKNIVAQIDLDMSIRLEKLIVALRDTGDEAEYEPEVFPGLIWKSKFGTANMFKNGKIMLLGCKSKEELQRLEAFVKDTLKKNA